MGIQGLLPLVRSVVQRVSISEFAGCVLAVDASAWLHRGAYATLDGEPDSFLAFPLKMVELLLSNGVRPLLVFDGGVLPIKAHQNRARQE